MSCECRLRVCLTAFLINTSTRKKKKPKAPFQKDFKSSQNFQNILFDMQLNIKLVVIGYQKTRSTLIKILNNYPKHAKYMLENYSNIKKVLELLSVQFEVAPLKYHTNTKDTRD